MRKGILFSVLAVMIVLGGFASVRALLTVRHTEFEKQERRNIELAIKAGPVDPNLPFILIIGDSISISYTLPVKLRLAGLVNVMRPLENCSSTLLILEKLDGWLGQTKWAVIHFNAGLHDLEHVQAENIAPGQQIMVPPDKGPRWVSLESYRANLEKIVARLKATGATLIFATTTPVPAGEPNRVAGDEVRYNEAALAVMRDNGVLIDDLHAAAVGSADRFQKPQDVHFYPEGSEILADHVATSIKAALPGGP